MRTLNRDGIPIDIDWNPVTGRFQEFRELSVGMRNRGPCGRSGGTLTHFAARQPDPHAQLGVRGSSMPPAP
jgi:hypothetical protein